MADHSHHDHAPVADQPHQHSHGHEHGHGHHHHDDGDTYFIDQLCMLGLSGAFGAICLCLYFLQTKMLANMLGAQFHLAILLAGIALTGVALVRGVILWRQSRDPHFKHGHDHSHDHGHDHSHAHDHAIKEQPPHAHGMQTLPMTSAPAPGCGHEHAPGDACGHDHHHDHGHDHHHEHAHAPAHGHGEGQGHAPAHQHEHGHHDHDEADHDHGWAPWRYVVVLVPIILFLLGLPSKPLAIEGFQPRATGVDFEQLILIFAGIVYEALPFIVAGVIVAGLLEEFVPQQAIAKIIPRNRVLAIMLGAVLGLVFPMCECGIIVVMKRLLRKGLPLSVCVAYMLAGPVINGIVIWTTYVAFNPPDPRDYILGGPWFVIAWRVGLSYLVACVTALVVDWQWNKRGLSLLHPSVASGLRHSAAGEDALVRRTVMDRLDNITRTALHDFVDILAFLILGALLAVIGRVVLKQSNIQDIFRETPAIAVLLMMGIAVLFCLCSEADAFVAANFPLFWPPASKIAFLVLGPMLDLKLYLMYTRVFRNRLIFTIMGSVVLQVFAYSMILHYFFDDTPIPPPIVEPIYLSAEEETHLRSIGFGPDPLTQLVHIGVAYNPLPSGKGEPYDFKPIHDLAQREDLRNKWSTKEGKMEVIEVRGQFMSWPASDQVFMLCRTKVGCCAGDGSTLKIPVMAREKLPTFAQEAWVKVTGRVVFRQISETTYETVVMVSKASDVAPCDPDPNPYVK